MIEPTAHPIARAPICWQNKIMGIPLLTSATIEGIVTNDGRLSQLVLRNDTGQQTRLYQRPFQLTCAQARVAMEAIAFGSFAKKFQALQQASTMSS